MYLYLHLPFVIDAIDDLSSTMKPNVLSQPSGSPDSPRNMKEPQPNIDLQTKESKKDILARINDPMHRSNLKKIVKDQEILNENNERNNDSLDREEEQKIEEVEFQEE